MADSTDKKDPDADSSRSSAADSSSDEAGQRIKRSRKRLYLPPSPQPSSARRSRSQGTGRRRGPAPAPESGKAAPDQRRQEALSIVRQYSFLSAGTGLVPIVLFDFLALSYLQNEMLKRLSILYGIEYSSQQGKILVTSVVNTIVPMSVSYTFSRILKAIPGLGYLSGGLLPATAGATAYATGRVFIEHFELGGTLLDLDADKIKRYVDEQNRKAGTAPGA